MPSTTLTAVYAGLWFEARFDGTLTKYRVRSRKRGGVNGREAWTCDVAMGTAGFSRSARVINTDVILRHALPTTPAW